MDNGHLTVDTPYWFFPQPLVSRKDQHGNTALHLAVMLGRREAVQVKLKPACLYLTAQIH